MAKPGLISLFSGVGGLDFGFEAAGFRTRLALEFDALCCKSLRANRRWPVLEADIQRVSTDYMLGYGRIEPGTVQLLIGGPPCQPFSKAGYWSTGDARRLDDPRAATLEAYLRVVEEALPEVFLLENVSGIAYSGKSEGLEYLLNRIEDINRHTGSAYAPRYTVLRAADYGVPQLRDRFILIAQRDGQNFSFPAPTHRPQPEGPELGLTPALPRYRTAWDALAELSPDPGEDLSLRGKWAELLPSIPEGENYLWHTDRGGGAPLFGWRRRYWSFLLKLAKDRPSWTIQAQPGPAIGPFHWHNRLLSARELMRLQTFPEGLHIQGNRAAIQRQVGNAVPSLLAEVLGREIRTQLLGLRPLKAPLRLTVPDRGPPPAAEPNSAVPERFLSMVGEHEAHPGTGRGYGALKRSA